MSEYSIVHLQRTRRLLAGHLWVFSNEIHESPKQYNPGELVEIRDRHEQFLGIGYFNPHSLIAVRVLTREAVKIDREFFRKRILEAISLRSRFFGVRDSLRLVFSEGDYIPGLIVDRYAHCLSIQTLTYGIETVKEMLVGLLDELLQPEVIVLRNDSRSRALEGLPIEKTVVKGDLKHLPLIREDGLEFEVDPLEGQKTGYFLDQKENRRLLRKIIKGGKGLDLFCYTGAWSLNLAYAGAEVIGVDSSERAIRLAEGHAERNSLSGRACFIKEDVFTFLDKELAAGEKRYDFIVLDPPALVKSGAKIKEAEKAYESLNKRCMRLLRSGGVLATSSCSYHMGREMFLEMIRNAGRGAGRSVRMLSLMSQDKDHPVLLSMPETEYLKCAFLLVD